MANTCSFGLLGPNGAGKTTAISMVCGLLDPDAGSITVNGVPIEPNSTKGRDLIGLVPQELALYTDMNGWDNLAFFARLYGLRGSAAKARIEEVLEVVGLTDRARDRVEEHSGGMQRRLNIAAGMLHRPKLLILDEPTVGIDPQSRNAILDAVAELGTTGMSVLSTTHYMEGAERLCRRVAIVGSWLLFGVDWKAPWAVLALSVGMALVGSGGAMLLGTLARTDRQVSAIGLHSRSRAGRPRRLDVATAVLPDALRRIAFATPHAWMNDALWRILVDGEGFAQIWPSVVVLAAAGIVLLAVASVALARTLR